MKANEYSRVFRLNCSLFYFFLFLARRCFYSPRAWIEVNVAQFFFVMLMQWKNQSPILLTAAFDSTDTLNHEFHPIKMFVFWLGFIWSHFPTGDGCHVRFLEKYHRITHFDSIRSNKMRNKYFTVGIRSIVPYRWHPVRCTCLMWFEIVWCFLSGGTQSQQNCTLFMQINRTKSQE